MDVLHVIYEAITRGLEAFSFVFFFFLLVSMRLRSVKNIQKITKSMKMVSAAKFGKAERELRPARVYGAGASGVLMRS